MKVKYKLIFENKIWEIVVVNPKKSKRAMIYLERGKREILLLVIKV